MNKIRALLAPADGILIACGAGMSVDSGIPDFRGDNGVWNCAKNEFLKYSTADAFSNCPLEAWNFYISRIIAYANIKPHKGYYDLLKLQGLGKDLFVVTSNVDGLFLKAGYCPSQVFEIHGDLRRVQCSELCCYNEWLMPEFDSVLETHDQIPRCPNCNAVLRPKVLMFNDMYFNFDRVDTQREVFERWLDSKSHICGIEIGAGKTVPSIRALGIEWTRNLIRINPHDSEITRIQDISIAESAIAGIDLIMQSLVE